MEIEDLLKNSAVIKCDKLPEKVVVLTNAIQGFNVYEIFRSDREELLKIADEIYELTKYCPIEESMFVMCSVLRDKSDRIRKALGED